MMLYCVLTLYGSSLLYKDVEDDGCDPSDGVAGNETCQSSGPDVFGAMLGKCWLGLLDEGRLQALVQATALTNPISVNKTQFIQVSLLRLKVSVSLATSRRRLLWLV